MTRCAGPMGVWGHGDGDGGDLDHGVEGLTIQWASRMLGAHRRRSSAARFGPGRANRWCRIVRPPTKYRQARWCELKWASAFY
jgi:hypothetical protein